MRFTKISEDTFKNLQLNAGMLLTTFNPDSDSATISSSTIIGATTGGVTFSAIAQFSDYGDDIDNCPKNMMELKKLESWEVKMSGTFVTITPSSATKMIGAADASGTAVTPRNDITTSDFSDVWWVGDYSDKNGATNGGYIAIQLKNSLSTGGFQFKSADKGKGNFTFEFTGHYSMEAQDTVPFKVWVKAGAAETG